MVISLSLLQWGKAKPTGHFYGLVVRGDCGHEGLWGLSVFRLRQSEERLGWGGMGYMLWCGEESVLQPTSSWMLWAGKPFRRNFFLCPQVSTRNFCPNLQEVKVFGSNSFPTFCSLNLPPRNKGDLICLAKPDEGSKASQSPFPLFLLMACLQDGSFFPVSHVQLLMLCTAKLHGILCKKEANGTP